MDIKDLNKPQLILLTLLITFVVSIATGIVTVSLMQQVPDSVPQTINNIIERTIEKVSTVDESISGESNTDSNGVGVVNDESVVVSVYSKSEQANVELSTKALGQGVIISDVGLILIDTYVLTEKEVYTVLLNKIEFDAIVLKKFGNGFTILKITTKSIPKPELPVTPTTPIVPDETTIPTQP